MCLCLEKWASEIFNYLYYDLVDGNKAKLIKYSGNSVVENQLVSVADMTQESNYNGITRLRDTNNFCIKFSGTSTSYLNDAYNSTSGKIQLIANHYYLFKVRLIGGSVDISNRTTTNYPNGYTFQPRTIWDRTRNNWDTIIFQQGSTIPPITMAWGCDNNVAFNNALFQFEIIDLTQMYPNNEPTSLTDKRIIAYLNEGYHEFNSGEIKDSVLGVLGSEPYNLFDEELEVGWINSNGGLTTDTNTFRSKNYTKVISGESYTLENILSGFTTKYFYQYDENKNIINYLASNAYMNTWSITLEANTKYIKFAYYKSGANFTNNLPTPQESELCLHRTGTRTGYAPHSTSTKITLPALLSIGGAINSHNTFEVLSDKYRFTRNVWNVDLGTLTYTASSSYSGKFHTDFSSLAIQGSSGLPNILCDRYTTINVAYTQQIFDTNDNVITVQPSNRIIIIIDKSKSSLSESDFKTAMSGVPLKYQLATPQVIDIPKRHLGVKYIDDISDLIYSGGFFQGTISSKKNAVSNNEIDNMYCPKLLSVKANLFNTTLLLCGLENSKAIRIRDDSCATVDQLKTKYAGVPIFYETQNEVQDFTNKMLTENGGTISGYEFSWVENQAITNSGSHPSYQSWTIDNSSGSSALYGTQQWNTETNYRLTIGHKYLLWFIGTKSYSGSGACKLYPNVANQQQDVFDFKTQNANIITINTIEAPSSLPTFNTKIGAGSTLTINGYLCLCDLTLAFPTDTPTSINDWRIQKILKMGYIPTNTSGTLKYVDCEVLPSVEMVVKK